MARDRSKYIKKTSLREQAYSKLQNMMAIGESKKEAKQNDEIKEKIFSKNTYKTYIKHIGYFCEWMKKEHPEIEKLKNAKPYVNEWLTHRTNSTNVSGERLSAWTIQTEAAALNKLYSIDKADPNRFQPPQRKREDIKRSRGTKARDKHFSKKTNEKLINFCKGTGLRRHILENIKSDCLYTKEDLNNIISKNEDKNMVAIAKDAIENFKDKEYFILSYRDKGGKSRFSPIVGEHTAEIVDRIRNTEEGKKVWEYVSPNCDVHGYRSAYATTIYKEYARNIEDIPYDAVNRGTGQRYRSSKEVYVCRGSEAGKVLDRKAVNIISKALGHNREDTAITNYLRDL